MSYRLTRLGGRYRDIVISLAIGFVAAIAAHFGFCNSKEYIETLSSAWRVFAAWFPIVIIILSLIASNSDKEFVKILYTKGSVEWLIDDVAICALFILLTTICLFVHGALNPPPVFWTFICTMATVATIFIFALMSRKIFYFAKYIARFESQKDKPKD